MIFSVLSIDLHTARRVRARANARLGPLGSPTFELFLIFVSGHPISTPSLLIVSEDVLSFARPTLLLLPPFIPSFIIR